MEMSVFNLMDLRVEPWNPQGLQLTVPHTPLQRFSCADYNTEECGWDGGDCCECTCEDEAFPCGPVYRCLDPTASCFGGEGDLGPRKRRFNHGGCSRSGHRFVT